MECLLAFPIGYAFGCFLTADVVCRMSVHKSCFSIGDGNPGMANVGHVLGTKAALAVLAGDILKTLLAVLISRFAAPAYASRRTSSAQAACLTQETRCRRQQRAPAEEKAC